MILFGFQVLALCLVLVQMLYWGLIFNRLASFKEVKIDPELPPYISIIICSHNRLSQLKKNLHSILTQNYPRYKVYLVDDGSKDLTAAFAGEIAQDQPHFSYLYHPKTAEGKKSAFGFGIKRALGEWILCTDDDCSPTSPLWLETMANKLVKNTQIVLGYAPFNRTKGLLNRFFRFECQMNAIQFMSATLIGLPYAAVGRNMLFNKEIFDETRLHSEILTGDDDLLINRTATAAKTTICLDPNSFMYSDAAENYSSYFQQKRRHYTSSIYYTFTSKLYLVIYFGSLIGLYACLLYLFSHAEYILAASLFFFQLLLKWLIFRKLALRMNEKDLVPYFPILELIYVGHLCLQIPFLFIQKTKW